MNQKGREKCTRLDEKFRTMDKEELVRRLIVRRNMGMLCHCSAEIDQSTLLYFSVNNMYLGSGDYIILLFAETSSHSKAQDEGMDVYSRSYTYTLIQEEVMSIFGGHYTIYPCELDGRLVALIQFHYGLMEPQREGLLHIISEHLMQVHSRCKKEYDINVFSYISEVFSDISLLSSIYHKLLSLVTLHQFENHFSPDGIFSMNRPDASAPSPIQNDMSGYTTELSNLIIAGQDTSFIIDKVLKTFIDTPYISTDELRKGFGEFYDSLSKELRLRGLRFNETLFHEEMIQAVMNAKHFTELSDWLIDFINHMKNVAQNKHQLAATSKYRMALSYIDENIADPMLSVRDIAEVVNLKSPALITLFKKNINMTPAAYIRETRLKKAAGLLGEGRLNVQQVSEKCGFGSTESFHRIFKVAYGLSPGRFRDLNK